MAKVNVESFRDSISFVLNKIINVIIENPSSKDDILNKVKSGELEVVSGLKPYVLKSLGFNDV